MLDDYIIKGIRQGQTYNNEITSNSYKRVEGIYGINPVKKGKENSQNADKNNSEKKKKGFRNMGKDSCDISKEGMDVYKTALKALKDIPDIREDKVQKIKQQLESGTYNVTPEMIAEKILKGTSK